MSDRRRQTTGLTTEGTTSEPKKCDLSNLSQDDIDEINQCFADCQDGVDAAKECCKRPEYLNVTFKQFLFNTLPGNIIIVLIVYTMIQMILNL